MSSDDRVNHMDETIAIIGMAGRFPGAASIDQFWHNLQNGIESVSFFSDEELLQSGASPQALADPSYIKAGAILENIECFDARLFGFSPREAELLDPQHRLFLECAWEALETAGYDSHSYQGLIGVFAGAGWSRYMLYNLLPNLDTVDEFQARLGTDKDFVPTRLSYKLNLKGPSVNIQTACSTSLVAIHMACQSLLNGECDMALAGAASLKIPQKTGYFYQENGVVSPDGHCRAFDARSQGFVPGSGAGIVLLKRLSDALRDGDSIVAVIKGSAINNDGAAKMGYTAPGVEGQAEVISEALAIAGVGADTIDYVETHGTGTALGDPIELRALTQAFRAQTKKRGFCAIGSVKTNIGHLDTAAGVAGVIKTALALKHKIVPPSLHFVEPNPEIDFEASPFYVSVESAEWKATGHPRRAGVSAFGIGGTNAHIILEEAPARALSAPSRPQQLLILSAKTPSALETCTSNLASYLATGDADLADVSLTLQVGRRALEHRRILVCSDVRDAVSKLESLDPRRVLTGECEPDERRVAFMFPGGGTQYPNMALDLYATEPAFQRLLDECAELVKPSLECDFRRYLYPPVDALDEATRKLKRTSFALPALFAVEYSLARLWMSWGIVPEAMIGHSLGEYVAACLAGVFSLRDALALVALRGKLIEKLPSGAMLSVPLPEQELRNMIGESLSLAAVNGPSHCVVSGPTATIERLAEDLIHRNVETRRLNIEAAGHSSMIEPILEAFGEFIERLDLSAPRIPFVSNLTGTWIRPSEATDPRYWQEHLRETVRFSQGLQHILENHERILLEVGPGNTLSTLARQHPERRAHQAVVSSMRHPKDLQSDVGVLLGSLGKVWLEGARVDWQAFHSTDTCHRVPLPTYPFERQRYWIDAPAGSAEKHGTKRNHSMSKKADIADWFYLPVWKESTAPRKLNGVDRGDGPTCCLIFTDPNSIGARLSERLVVDGNLVTVVIPGEGFAKLDDRLYCVNPRQRDDYEALLKEMESLGLRPRKIVHLWSVTSNDTECSDLDSVDQVQNLGFYSLLLLTQALGEQVFSAALTGGGGLEALEVLIVTNDMQDVTGEERLRPEKATVLGPCRVIPQEYPNVTCRSIDITIPETRKEDQLVDHLVGELGSNSADRVVAYRGNHRWVQAFEQVRLSQSSSPRVSLREGGVYLISGGLRGIGLELAAYLARTVRARMILTTHSFFPCREDWQKWLDSHPQDDMVSGQIQRLREIESTGAEVIVGFADVADSEAMSLVVGEARERFGGINGVIHSAGVRPEGIIQQKEHETSARTLAPKVKGTLVLSRSLADSTLDFFVLCSSLRAIVGGTGMVDHAAANSFLDAFAHSRRKEGEAVVSINWDSWGEVGQSIIPSGRLAEEQKLKARMLTVEGIEAFGRVLETSLSQVIVSIQDIQSAIDFYSGAMPADEIHDIQRRQSSGTAHSRPHLRTAYVAPGDEVEVILAGIWQDLLGLEKVGIHDNFFELGGDSVIGIRIIARCSQAGLRLTPRKVFEHQTIAELAAAAERMQPAEYDQGPVTGPVPLTPIQRWFFDRDPQSPHKFALAALLEFEQQVDAETLERAIRELMVHHDALRLRFVREGSEWQQFSVGPDQPTPFGRTNLSGLTAEEQDRAVERISSETLESMNLTAGPIARFELVEFGIERPSRLLILINHLVVDARSWRVLLEDLQASYEQLRNGEAVKLGAKATSFKQWAVRLLEYAQSSALEQELPYWLDDRWARMSSVPVDFPEGINDEASARRISVSLSQDETSALLHEAPRSYQVEADDVLLTALAQTFARWTGRTAQLFDIESDGREALFSDVDLSRTTGWFTIMSPVRLDPGEGTTAGDALKVVKHQLRSLPSRGAGHGLLRYLSANNRTEDQMRKLPRAEVNFLYLGQVAQGLSGRSFFRVVEDFKWQSPAAVGSRSHLLQVSVRVIGGQLRVDWTFSVNIHKYETVQRLADNFIAALRELIEFCLSSEDSAYTPSDFPDVYLSQGELDNIISRVSTTAE
jgi:non-ribosomal peptide synthase protein (TIGR01720 family)